MGKEPSAGKGSKGRVEEGSNVEGRKEARKEGRKDQLSLLKGDNLSQQLLTNSTESGPGGKGCKGEEKEKCRK